jgi:hypothetical protein
MSAARRIPRPRPASSHASAPEPGVTTIGSRGPVADHSSPVPGPGTVVAERTTTLRTKRRSRSRAVAPDPLGSLTQRDHRTGATCRECGSPHVTRLTMSLTDGTPVEFTSCHHCEHRSWEHAGSELTVQSILDRARKD